MSEQPTPSEHEQSPPAGLASFPAPAGTSTALSSVQERRQRAVDRMVAFAENAVAANTKRGYRADWADFVAWCDTMEARALPATPQTVALYVSDRAKEGPPGEDGTPTTGLKVATLERRLSAINQVHRAHGHPAPANRRDEPLKSAWSGMVGELGRVQDKAPVLSATHLLRMVRAMPTGDDGELTLTALRDRALLLFGFAAALRRSELVAVRAEHLTFQPAGIRLLIPRSKTDQSGEGYPVAVHYGERAETCPVLAVREWLDAAALAGVGSQRPRTAGGFAAGVGGVGGEALTGPVFRKVDRWGRLGPRALAPATVSVIVKKAAERARIDGATTFSGHSLRSGHATAAAKSGREERDIMAQTRHKSEKVLRGYIQEGQLFDRSTSQSIGL